MGGWGGGRETNRTVTLLLSTGVNIQRYLIRNSLWLFKRRRRICKQAYSDARGTDGYTVKTEGLQYVISFERSRERERQRVEFGVQVPVCVCVHMCKHVCVVGVCMCVCVWGGGMSGCPLCFHLELNAKLKRTAGLCFSSKPTTLPPPP